MNDRWQFDAADGETYLVETEAIRDDTIVRIKRRDGMGVELSYKWSESLLVQALLALVEQPPADDAVLAMPKNKILDPGGKSVYARGDISLRSYDGGFIGLWQRSYELDHEEHGRYSMHELVEIFDSYHMADAIEAAVRAAAKP